MQGMKRRLVPLAVTLVVALTAAFLYFMPVTTLPAGQVGASPYYERVVPGTVYGVIPPGLHIETFSPPCTPQADSCPDTTVLEGTPTQAGTYHFLIEQSLLNWQRYSVEID